MKVNHSGWSEKYDSFSYDVVIDENKTDYVLTFRNGHIGRQCSPFQFETRDWNCDCDVYEQFGAYFRYFDRQGEPCGSGFWTPQDLVGGLVHSIDPIFPEGNDLISVSGVSIPVPEKRPSLQEQMSRSEQRQMAQDIERNRQMKMFGIRPPGEPWAK